MREMIIRASKTYWSVFILLAIPCLFAYLVFANSPEEEVTANHPKNRIYFDPDAGGLEIKDCTFEITELNEPNCLTIDISDIDLTSIHKKPIPFPSEYTTLAVISFVYTDCNETRSVEFIINDVNELEIKYENCTPKEGARIAYWLMENYN